MKKKFFADKLCVSCGSPFNRKRRKNNRLESIVDFELRKFCSSSCFHLYNTGEKHHFWKGGTKTRPDGYLRNSRTGQYIHREVVENNIGRKLLPDEHVHHKDGDNTNNSIENLMIVSNSEHRKIESKIAKRDKKGRFSCA